MPLCSVYITSVVLPQPVEPHHCRENFATTVLRFCNALPISKCFHTYNCVCSVYLRSCQDRISFGQTYYTIVLRASTYSFQKPGVTGPFSALGKFLASAVRAPGVCWHSQESYSTHQGKFPVPAPPYHLSQPACHLGMK